MNYQELFPIPLEWLRESDRSMAETVSAWAGREVKSKRLEHKEEYDALLLPAIKKLFLEIGLQGMMLPEEVGGGGLDSPEAAMTAAAILEQAGAADTGIGFLLANMLAVQYAALCGGGESRARAASMFAGEELFLVSLVLPGYGADVDDRPRYYGLDFPASAVATDGGYEVSGGPSRPQCCGATAGAFAVVCDMGGGNPGLLLVSADAKGVTWGGQIRETGLAASVNADVTFDGVRVDSGGLLLKGREPLREVLSWYYLACSAACAGALQAVHEILREWGDTRVIKGKGQVFKENPLVASLMGEIGGRISTSRILTYNLGRLLSRPEIYGSPGSGSLHVMSVSVLKQVTGLAMEAMHVTMELMASAGYATEWNLERYWRDVKTVQAYVLPETVAETCMARQYFDLQKL